MSALPSSLRRMEHDEARVSVEIDRDSLEMLLHFARIGDAASSTRSFRTKFRKGPVCSGDRREPDCAQCQAFTVAEAVLGRSDSRAT